MSWNGTAGLEINTSTASKIFLCVLILITFLFGLVVNNLYLWVLGFRISKTVDSICFFHFILASLVYTLVLPIFFVYVLFYPDWVMGLAMCKLMNFSLSVSMFEAVFVLTVISIDRYKLVFKPHWCRSHMKPCYATVICVFLWGLAFACSSPYILFRELRMENTTTVCYNDYTQSGMWKTQQSQEKVKWSIYMVRLFVGYVFPLLIISFCYFKILVKMRKEGLVKSNRPYKIILTTVGSFFFCWFPYHLWYGMNLEEVRSQESTLGALKIITVCLTCFNFCFTPIFYLFIIESFKKIFKKSILSLIESMFHEVFVSNRSLEDRATPPLSSGEVESPVDNN